jgi:LacI family transcriptional regulator
MKHRAATIADIGRELGLSAMTVSRALNGSPDVNEETRQRVLSHAARVKYRPNRWARSLVTQKSRVIGMVVPDISHSFFSEITRAVQQTLEPHGYALMLCHTDGDVRREEAAIDMLLGSRVDGLIVASQRGETDPGMFTGLRTPFVLLDRSFQALECACARTDDVQVGELAAQHLIDLGHRRIAHLLGCNVSAGRLRFEGFRRVMLRNGVAYQSDHVVEGGFRFDGGYAGMQRLLALNPRPTAVFAANDPSAIGAIQACRDAGLRVPEDMSIIGAGAVEGPLTPLPFLTTVDWSRESLGREAAELLLGAMDDNAAPPREFIAKPMLVKRRSTGPCRMEAPCTPAV